jgi:hypothetical protein
MHRTRLTLAGAAALVAGVVAVVLAPGGDGSRTFHAQAVHAAAAEVSTNWSGYVVTGLGSTATTAAPSTNFKNVTGTWRVPKATCAATGTGTASAVWVGLGGYSTDSKALEQTGTSSECGVGGAPTYFAWWEIIPAPAVRMGLKVRPGDLVTGSVLVTGSEVLMQIINRTRKTRFTKRVDVDSPDLTSAEWIAEAPSACSTGGFCRQVPLANFGTVTFTRVAALATIDGLGDQGGTITSSLWQATPIELVPQRSRRFFGGAAARPDTTAGRAGAAPVGLATDGRSFSVSWVANAGSR